jgi:hypothetical protein
MRYSIPSDGNIAHSLTVTAQLTDTETIRNLGSIHRPSLFLKSRRFGDSIPSQFEVEPTQVCSVYRTSVSADHTETVCIYSPYMTLYIHDRWFINDTFKVSFCWCIILVVCIGSVFAVVVSFIVVLCVLCFCLN